MKLSVDLTFKHNFLLEEYLSIKNEQQRSAMTKLRASAHSLAIQKGRYSRPSTPVSERIYLHCPWELIEDELHFMTECEQYNT